MDTKIRKSEKRMVKPPKPEHKRKFQSVPLMPKVYPPLEVTPRRKEIVLSKISEEKLTPPREHVHKPKRTHPKQAPINLAEKLMQPKLVQHPTNVPDLNYELKKTVIERIGSSKKKSKPVKKKDENVVKKIAKKSTSPASNKSVPNDTGLKTYISGFQKLINKNIFEIFKPPDPLKDDVKVDVVYSRQFQKENNRSEFEEKKRPHTAPLKTSTPKTKLEPAKSAPKKTHKKPVNKLKKTK